MKTIVSITGIRPDFIRMSHIFKKLDQKFDHVLVHTGQHYDKLLSDIFFQDLKIRQPNFNLQIGALGKHHYHQQAELGVKIIELFHLHKIKPDLVIFLGDSNSVLASVPLKKEGYVIAHIEAGMRSYDDRMLEETNRVVCDHVSSLLFVYHENYKQKLLKEGIKEEKIFVVGNTIVEPLTEIADFNYKGVNSHILLDIHRPENFKYKNRMEKILDYAVMYSKKFNKNISMLSFSRTMKSLQDYNLNLPNELNVVDLMGYKDFIKYQQDSLFIISDSGTAQEEPALLSIPVIVPREYTERPESVDNGDSFMLELNQESFEESVFYLCNYKKTDKTWLGDGKTSEKITDIISRI